MKVLSSTKSLYKLTLQMFFYSEDDFSYIEQRFNSAQNSRLDNELEAAFTRAMDAGMLRYRQEKGVNKIREITAPNGCKMIAEFNNNRGFNKRPRHPFESVSLPFDAEKFNFNKV